MTRSLSSTKLGVLALALIAAPVFTAASASAATAPNITPLGPENPNKVMTVSVMLNMRNQAALDALVKQIHTKGNPNYRKFLTPAQVAANYAPTAAQSLAVQNFLKSQGLTITYVDKLNLTVSARGTVANIEKAFNTQVGLFQSNGQKFDQPTAPPTVSGSVGSTIKHISGLTTLTARNHAVRAINLSTGKPIAPIAVKGHKNGIVYPSDCFESSAPIYLYGTGLEAIYSGNGYPTSSGCGYDAANLEHAYGLDTVYGQGLTGAGQTVVIVDAYGSNTIAQDLATYSALNGLPPATLNIINNPAGGTPDCVVSNSVQCGWEVETTLDVEMVHAMAPGATIDLIEAPTAQFGDLANIDLWIAENLQTASVSHSFGFPEWLLVDYYGDTADYDFQYSVNEFADQVMGISNNYSTGDDGDYVTLGEDFFPDVSFPSGSPNATAVGGTSLILASNGNYKFEEGWGTNYSVLNYAPPLNENFYGGAGGGTSLITPAPAWQTDAIGATMRQQPDVAMAADPFTGAELVITSDGVIGDPQFFEVIGGTSMSCPEFSGTWSLVAQKVGGNLGNAAPIIYEEAALFPGSLHDVAPVGSGSNAHGTIFTNGIPTPYSQWQLAGDYQNSQTFWESLWNLGNGEYLSVTFGTDSSLTTNVGWDNVTGIGTPNGWSFIGPYCSDCL